MVTVMEMVIHPVVMHGVVLLDRQKLRMDKYTRAAHPSKVYVGNTDTPLHSLKGAQS